METVSGTLNKRTYQFYQSSLTKYNDFATELKKEAKNTATILDNIHSNPENYGPDTLWTKTSIINAYFEKSSMGINVFITKMVLFYLFFLFLGGGQPPP